MMFSDLYLGFPLTFKWDSLKRPEIFWKKGTSSKIIFLFFISFLQNLNVTTILLPFLPFYVGGAVASWLVR